MALQFTRGFLYRARYDKSELLNLLDEAKSQLLTSGPESILSWSDNGTTVSKRPEMTVAEWLDEIAYSLALIDPENYGDRVESDETIAAFPNRY